MGRIGGIRMVYLTFISLMVLFLLEVICFDQMRLKVAPSKRGKRYLSSVCIYRDNSMGNHALCKLLSIHRMSLAVQVLISVVCLWFLEEDFDIVFIIWGIRSVYSLVIVWWVPSDRM